MIIAIVSLLSVLTYMHTSSFNKLFLNLHKNFTRDYRLVPNGEIIKLGGKVTKNSSGYSLKDLLIGSEGTLGIVTQLNRRLIPMPRTAVEFMRREVIEEAEKYLGKNFPDKTSDAYLLLTFDGNSAEEIEKIYDDTAKLCLGLGAVDVYISDTQESQESIWSARGAFLEAIKSSTDEMDECDVVVPRDKIAIFMKFVNVVETDIK